MRLGLWVRMAVAGLLLAVVTAALVAFEFLFVSVMVGGIVLTVLEVLGVDPSAYAILFGDWFATIAAASATVAALVVGYHLVRVVRAERDEGAVLREYDPARRRDDGTVELQTSDPVDPDALRARARRLAQQAGVPAPDVRITRAWSPIAATVGYRPSTSTVVLSTGLLDALDGDELDAVLAHELAHVVNRDAAVMTALELPEAQARSFVDRWGDGMIVGFLLAGLCSLASRWGAAVVGRHREYAADAGAAALTGKPAALAGALERLDAELDRRPGGDLRETSSAGVLSIVPPPPKSYDVLERPRRFLSRRVFGAHPPTEARIERLRSKIADDR